MGPDRFESLIFQNTLLVLRCIFPSPFTSQRATDEKEEKEEMLVCESQQFVLVWTFT